MMREVEGVAVRSVQFSHSSDSTQFAQIYS